MSAQKCLTVSQRDDNSVNYDSSVNYGIQRNRNCEADLLNNSLQIQSSSE